MRGRGCADCEKACDRKRRDGRTAHPNCLGHACNLASKAGVEAATACTCGLGSRCAISRHSAARSRTPLKGSSVTPQTEHINLPQATGGG
jgi:hypothetical protein